MDLFVFPSHTDTFGNVVLEALASGVPAIVTPNGGPCTIVRDGETGRIVPDAEFASAVAGILADPEKHAADAPVSPRLRPDHELGLSLRRRLRSLRNHPAAIEACIGVVSNCGYPVILSEGRRGDQVEGPASRLFASRVGYQET